MQDGWQGLSSVIAGLDPAIHLLRKALAKGWTRGSSPLVSLLLVATASRSATVKQHQEDLEYEVNDAAALNGGSFVALRDHPGPCPGPGWQLLAASGKRGVAGERGPHAQALPASREKTPQRSFVGR
jgi:hypothetical protein